MNQVTISQFVGALLRHKIKSLIVFFLVFGLAVTLFLVWPRKFGSEGRLFVQLGRNNAGLDPTGGSSSVSIQDSRETEILSVAEIAKSRAVIEAVVDEIGPDEILESPLKFLGDIAMPDFRSMFKNPEAVDVSDDGLSKEEFSKLRTREEAARKLEESLVIHTGKKTSVISIYVTAPSARMAQQIVDSVMRITREKHLEVHSIKGSTKFFDEEFAKYERLLEDAIDGQIEFRNELGILSLDGARESLQQIVSRLENDLITAIIENGQAEASVERLEEELAQIEKTIDIATAGVERLSFEDSRTELNRLKNERASLLATRSEQNPQIIQLNQAILEAEASLKEMTSDRTESAIHVNPVYENVQTSYVQALVSRNAAASRLKNVREKIVEHKLQLETLNASSGIAEKHQRNVALAKQYLATYATKRGESRVFDELDKQRISDVVIAQPANFVVKHVSPRGAVMLLLGGISSALMALAAALFFDRNNLSANIGEEEVEQILDMPVLVTLPRVYSSRNMVN